MNPLKFIYDKLMGRRMAYRSCFLGEDGKLSQDGELVMADLMKFCRSTKSTAQISPTGVIDPFATHLAEGRREVLIRIQSQLGISDMDLRELAQQMAGHSDNQ
jgi:hypothetical protein